MTYSQAHTLTKPLVSIFLKVIIRKTVSTQAGK